MKGPATALWFPVRYRLPCLVPSSFRAELTVFPTGWCASAIFVVCCRLGALKCDSQADEERRRYFQSASMPMRWNSAMARALMSLCIIGSKRWS